MYYFDKKPGRKMMFKYGRTICQKSQKHLFAYYDKEISFIV